MCNFNGHHMRIQKFGQQFRMNSFKIRTLGMLRSCWSNMLPWRCTRRIECCGNLDSDN
ncbi:hypothetical protein Goklo_020995 [Gossypium klotzschianum]|uniref:Uncharacterized protein n=1 Tax=Gossypium klotzschianum TaxID=34286 RepID=A0A7J8UTY3_9ROSI|nr:hypothetical protein [Gossypium klotzschianum]